MGIDHIWDGKQGRNFQNLWDTSTLQMQFRRGNLTKTKAEFTNKPTTTQWLKQEKQMDLFDKTLYLANQDTHEYCVFFTTLVGS